MFQSNLKGTDARDKTHTNKGAIVGMKETPRRKIFLRSDHNESVESFGFLMSLASCTL
jgi:hypothetical protein